jgi:hypothetical protein
LRGTVGSGSGGVPDLHEAGYGRVCQDVNASHDYAV